MALMFTLAGMGSLIGGIGGLFGGKKGDSAAKQVRDRSRGARQAAERDGFNPLTMLGVAANATATPGTPPPLASIDLIVGGLKAIDDERSGDADRRRAMEQHDLDLAKLKLDQARSGVLLPPPPIASGVGVGVSPLGRRTGTQTGQAGAAFNGKLGGFGTPTKGPNNVAPGREQDIDPVVNSPGVFEMENVLTGGKPVTIPGEGEPWGIDELLTGLIVGGPQALGNLGNRILFDGKRIDHWAKDKAKENEKREKKRAKKSPVSKKYDGPGGPVYLPR
ncbi:hypothetical protein [Tortoise microvirus 38]|nr:hypothetical protein [Tortoise microvirus 38]